ncbi:hypothetical protein N0V90_012445 [Kalmusia sp. IMI 367209]|nr:hypothetical protein N0V90_012445 [Kalmusia sp. IMI 367209]
MNTTAKAGNNGLSTGAKAGIGVGAAVGAIAIMLAAFFGHKAYGYRKLAKEREVEDQHALQSSIYEHEQKPRYDPTVIEKQLQGAE